MLSHQIGVIVKNLVLQKEKIEIGDINDYPGPCILEYIFKFTANKTQTFSNKKGNFLPEVDG